MYGNEIYSGSHSDEVQVNCPGQCVPRLLSVEVYLMRSGTAIGEKAKYLKKVFHYTN